MDCCDSQFWLVVCGFIVAFILAFGIGANDVANSFGTSVGSKVLTLKQACILATIFEILGSILIGAKVSGTIRKGIVKPQVFAGSEIELMLGYVSALIGCCVWLILATILNLPVSGTHSIVGATIGMAIVSKGFLVIEWLEIARIVSSWFISPILSGIVSLLMFLLIRKFILITKNPLKAGLRYLPLIYTITICVNIGGILESSPPLLGFDKIPAWGKGIIALAIGVIVYLGVWLVMVPYMKKKIEGTMALNAAAEAEMGEKEKLYGNSLDYIDNGYSNNENKKTIATQVDYVSLIMARNYDDWKFTDEDQNQLIPKKTEENDYMIKNSAIQTEKQNRKRLISAPSTLKDNYDVGDVNLTLRGYLHTIHMPAMRHQLSLKSQNLKQPNSNKSQASVTSSKAEGGEISLKRLFIQPGTENPENSTNNENANNMPSSELKRGRFNLVPAKFSNDLNITNQSNLVNEDKIMTKSLLEIDAEVDENISELPTKHQKKIEYDEFALADPPEAAKLFSFLQVLTAVFGSFAHGGNDVSNAIGPLIGLYLIYTEGKIIDKSSTPEWILFYGGVGISVGLWVLGRKVIKTIGEDLTKITASSGFVIELASAMTVLGASLINIPVSTTHCKVGSVVFTGRVRSKQSVDWSLFRNIIIAWIVTVPVTGSIAAACQFILLKIYR